MTDPAHVWKVLVLGPKRSGKTAISNHIAENDIDPEHTAEYHATVGVRILEFDRTILQPVASMTKAGHSSELAVEMWDCSGDTSFKPSWPAMARDSHAAIFVFDPKTSHSVMEDWLESFQQLGGLTHRQCLVLFHSSRPGAAEGAPPSLPRKFETIAHIESTLESAGEQIQEEFDLLLQEARAVYEEQQEAQAARLLHD